MYMIDQSNMLNDGTESLALYYTDNPLYIIIYYIGKKY